MEKYAIFAFRGEPVCFTHVMLNALDLDAKGHDVKVILEGEAVELVQTMREGEIRLFAEMESKGLIDAVCRACSATLGVLEYNEKSGLRMAGEMNGHVAFSTYTDQGYTIITL